MDVYLRTNIKQKNTIKEREDDKSEVSFTLDINLDDG